MLHSIGGPANNNSLMMELTFQLGSNDGGPTCREGSTSFWRRFFFLPANLKLIRQSHQVIDINFVRLSIQSLLSPKVETLFARNVLPAVVKVEKIRVVVLVHVR
jgi:hypothetical protein